MKMAGPTSSTIYILLTFLLFAFVQHSCSVNAANWNVRFDPSNFTDKGKEIHMDSSKTVTVYLTGLNKRDLILTYSKIFVRSNSDILKASLNIPVVEIDDNGSWSGTMNITASFIGRANVFVSIVKKNGDQEDSMTQLPVTIIRRERAVDKLFTISVITLVSILYINFGAALDLKKVKGVLIRPIGPAIAFFCHFIFLPLSSYVLGLILFPDNIELQLGLFFTGTCPAGGASNMWTVLLGGNVDLSITMSTTSTLAAFGMMPLWIFTLGKTIFDRGEMIIPYSNIATYVYGLIIPLGIGLLIQKYLPRAARFLVRILKTCSAFLIIFIVVFAIITNLYLFQLFTWEIFIAGILLPWLGYFVGWLVAMISRLEYEDRLAVAVEAGIQNTGIAIFILRLTLDQPGADLTTVIPVAVAIMTPFPLMAYYLCYKGREIYRRRRDRNFPHEIKECIDAQESGVY